MNAMRCAALLVCFTLISAYYWTPKKPGHPVVLVPGDGGTQMDAKIINKTSVVHYLCKTHTDYWYDIWLNLELFAPYLIGCWTDDIRLVYNVTTRRSVNSPGVATRVTNWGNTTSVEWLDPSKTSAGLYFAKVVENAVNWGYKRAKDIRGAPYDFRKAPTELANLMPDLKKLIEDTYYQNGNRRVVIIAHSMGNPVTLYFLNRQTQAWKDKFIRSYVCLAGPWGGSIKILKLFASGYNFDHWSFVLPPLKVRDMQRSLTSSAFLMPSDKFWGDEVLVSTDKRNYTTKDYKQFFTDIKFPLGWDMYQEFGKLFYDLTPPGVEVHCLYGTNMSTPWSFRYGKGQFPDTQPTDVFGDGDGTVTTRSATGCKRWIGQQKQPVRVQGFAGVDHLGIMQSPAVIAYIKKVLY